MEHVLWQLFSATLYYCAWDCTSNKSLLSLASRSVSSAGLQESTLIVEVVVFLFFGVELVSFDNVSRSQSSVVSGIVVGFTLGCHSLCHPSYFLILRCRPRLFMAVFVSLYSVMYGGQD